MCDYFLEESEMEIEIRSEMETEIKSEMEGEMDRRIIELEKSKKQYEALLNENWATFISYYRKDLTEMHPMTLAKDFASHMAVYSKNEKPLEDLLVKCPLILEDVVHMKNVYGNTPLHVAATTGNIMAVKLLVEKNPNLLTIPNNVGETPLFKAAAFGCTKIVKFLASQSEQFLNKKLLPMHCWRKGTQGSGTSILHIAVEGEHFDTALELIKLDKSLNKELEDNNGMTCLQLLAKMPSAFKSGYPMGLWKSILYKCLPNKCGDGDDDDKDDDTRAHLAHLARSIYLLFLKKCPGIKKIWKEKRKHILALKLAKKLIQEDKSWAKKHNEDTDVSSLYSSGAGVEEENYGKRKKMHEFGLKLAKLLMKEDISCEKEDFSGECQRTIAIEQCKTQFPTSAQGKGEGTQKKTETPLLLATRHGIQEIVIEILGVYPQAIEHCNHMGQNILQVVIKHRQKEIFDLVKEKEIPMKLLVRGIDVRGYTIMHHAATLNTKENRSGPALQLQEELKWLKRARKYIPSHYVRHVDREDQKTAEELFKIEHEDQLESAQKWIKETSQSCSAVAVLVATVVFAAAYTVPGDYNSKGYPNLLHTPFFKYFTILDIISLASSLTSVVMFLSILSSPFEQDYFLSSLPRKLMAGFTLLFLSVATTMSLFAVTFVLLIQLENHRGFKTLLYMSAFLPVLVFALVQFPLYSSFLRILKGSSKAVTKFVSSPFRKKKSQLNLV